MNLYSTTVESLFLEVLTKAGYSADGITIDHDTCSNPELAKLFENGFPNYIITSNEYPSIAMLAVCKPDNSEHPKAFQEINQHIKGLFCNYNLVVFAVSGSTPETFKIDASIITKNKGILNKTNDSKTDFSTILNISEYNTIFVEQEAKYVQAQIQANSAKISDISSSIWGIADILRGSFKEPQYGDVIIPMTILTRLDAEIAKTKDEVIDTENKLNDLDIPDSDKEATLMRVANHYYYNTSGYDLRDVARNDDHDTFINYLDGYSDNVKEIFNKLDFINTIGKLDDAVLINPVVNGFIALQDQLARMSQDEMGTIFEYLVRRFSEKDNDGEHFTSPDIVKLCCALLIDSDEEKIKNTKRTYNIYDQAMGTSQMLTVMSKIIKDLNSDNVCNVFGQEINPKTWGIASANELIKTPYNPDKAFQSNLMLGNTLTNDRLSQYKFDYCISNPPFGVKYDMYAETLYDDPKFASVGFPAKSDGQMLFDLNGVYHLNERGRMAIIHNGSPLFSGNGGSGEAAIREHLITNDLIEAIVKLPNDLFYNTGITTYIWVITKEKKENRKGKIQLIDASQLFKKLRKAQGNRKNEITDECRELVFNTLNKFEEAEYTLEGTDKVCKSKIFDNEYFKGEPDAQGRYKWEIPFDKLFYVAEEKQDSESIKQRIIKLNAKIQAGMTELFGN